MVIARPPATNPATIPVTVRNVMWRDWKDVLLRPPAFIDEVKKE